MDTIVFIRSNNSIMRNSIVMSRKTISPSYFPTNLKKFFQIYLVTKSNFSCVQTFSFFFQNANKQSLRNLDQFINYREVKLNINPLATPLDPTNSLNLGVIGVQTPPEELLQQLVKLLGDGLGQQKNSQCICGNSLQDGFIWRTNEPNLYTLCIILRCTK